tara:strand:- start:207 stop:356 length:150 start_codon:yes stop_codon:yes gene_type:complete
VQRSVRRRLGGQRQRRVTVFPPLQQCRDEFEATMRFQPGTWKWNDAGRA